MTKKELSKKVAEIFIEDAIKKAKEKIRKSA